MSFLLDTDICSAQLKNVRIVSNRFLQYGGRLFASAVTIAELRAWLLRKQTAQRHKQAYARLRQDLMILDVDERIALRAGDAYVRAVAIGCLVSRARNGFYGKLS